MMQTQTVKFSALSSSNLSGLSADDAATGLSAGILGGPAQSNSFVINSPKVVVELNSTTHTSGSSAVATRNITNYPWELVYIPGNLVAVHSSGSFIAYAVQAPNSTSGIVRIISRRTAIRGLIKNIPGLIKDLSFAYVTGRILLAFVDQFGTLFVYEIHEEDETLRTELLIEIKRSENEERSDYQRVIWCPFIPDDSVDEDQDESEEENFAYLLVVTNGPVAEIWHLMTLMHSHGSGSIDHSKIESGSGHQVMEKHSSPISDAAFSPDGTALATASLDGYVKFFQVILSSQGQNSPRCLHQWKPHDGKPLSCLFFLDNHKNPTSNVQFWKYAVTGACNNTEIKTWSCETWQCNQVISFEVASDSKLDSSKLALKAAIDPSSKHFILSDIYRRVLYVLVVSQEGAFGEVAVNGDSTDTNAVTGKVGVARIVSISELPVQYPAIFLSITEAEWKPYKRWKHEHPGDDCFPDKDDVEEECDDNDIVEGLVLKCILINTKSLQDATIRFQPALPLQSTSYGKLCDSSNYNLSLSEDSVILKDGLTDLSINLSTSLNELDNSKSKSMLTESNIEVALDTLVSFSSKASPKAVLEADCSLSRVPPSSMPSSVIASLPSVLSEAKTVPILSSPTISNSADCDCTVSSQPLTMNLLTPESFSSPGRTDDDLLQKKESDLIRSSEVSREIFPKTTPSPSEELKSAALSLMLRVNSGSRLPTSDVISPGTSMATLTSLSSDSKIGLETVIVKSPSIISVPPPLSSGSMPMPTSEDTPMATSEVSRNNSAKKSSADSGLSNYSSSVSNTAIPHVGSGVGLASSTSSPSLEVQQILHSHNNKNEDYVDDDEVEMEGNNVLDIINSKNERTSLSESLIDHPPPITSQSPSSFISPASSIPSQPPSFISPVSSHPPHPSSHSFDSSSLLSSCPSSKLPSSIVLTSSNILSSSSSGVRTTGVNGNSGVPAQAISSNSNSLQDLINITAGSKVDVQKIEQSPLLDMFASLKSFSSPRSSHLMDSGGLQHSSPLCDSSSVINVTKLTEVLPSSSLGFGSKDSNDTVPLFKSISGGKTHVTCEELEAGIKCTSPSNKKAQQQQQQDFLTNSANSLSTFVFPMNLGDVNGVTSSARTPSALEADLKRHEKSMEEISNLRQLIISSHRDQEENTKNLLAMTRTLANQVDKNAKNMHQINKAVEDIRRSQNKMQDSLAPMISSSIRPIIESSVRQEFKNSLSPVLNKYLESLKNNLSSEMRSLVSNSEAHLTDSLIKAACTRQFVDNVSSSVAATLSNNVQTACRDAYNKIVVPGFNAITQQVFSQLNEAFTRGTKEYMQHVENESQSTRNSLMENLGASSRTLETTSTNLSTSATILMETLQKLIAQQTTLSETLGERLRHFVHDEIARALQEHHAAVEARTSRAQTPAATNAGSHTPTNPKIARQQVQQLLSQEQFNLAFKQALSASDLSLVVFVCERINPQQLFSQTPCPLSQDVLLSLVNQLSHDLSTFTDLKTKYLEEAVMNLDTTHPVTREHMRKVLQEFQRSLSTYLELNPNHKKLKMLLLAVNHLVAA